MLRFGFSIARSTQALRKGMAGLTDSDLTALEREKERMVGRIQNQMD